MVYKRYMSQENWKKFAKTSAASQPISIREPFLHHTYSAFFDRNVYENIEEYWPNESLFDHFYTETGSDLNGKKTTLNQNRCSYANLNRSLDVLGGESSEFWDYFLNDYIKKRIEWDDVMMSPIQNRLQNESSPLKVDIFGSLIEDLEGSAQGIHIDPTNIISTLVAYVPLKGQSSDLGTKIYSIPEEKRNFETYMDYDLDLQRTYVSNCGSRSPIKPAGQIPYLANHAVLIPFSPFALHSVTNPTRTKRRSLLIRAAIHSETMLNVFGYNFDDLMRLANKNKRFARAIYSSMLKIERDAPTINSEIEITYKF
jgi:hypothetical protein